MDLIKAKSQLEDEVRLRLDFEQKINKLNNYNRKLQVGTRTLEQDIKDLTVKLKDMTATNKILEQQYLEARSKMQMSENIITRLKEDCKGSAENKDKAQDLYQDTLEKLLEVEKQVKRRQATALELQILLQKKESQI